MEKMNALTLIITLVVGVILTGALLAPVIDDATDHTVVYTNSASGESYIFANETVTFSWDGAEYLVNNEPTTPLSNSYATITSDLVSVRWATAGPSIMFFDTGVAYQTTTFKLTAANGSLTGTYSTTTDSDVAVNVSYETLYYQDATGSFVMTSGTSPIYLHGNTEIIVNGFNTNIGGSGGGRFFLVSGTLDDGLALVAGGTTYTDYTVNATKISNVDDVYAVTSIVFENVNGVDVTLNRFIVPATITTTEIGFDGSDALLKAIPIMVIVALLMAAVGAIALRRAD